MAGRARKKFDYEEGGAQKFLADPPPLPPSFLNGIALMIFAIAIPKEGFPGGPWCPAYPSFGMITTVLSVSCQNYIFKRVLA